MKPMALGVAALLALVASPARAQWTVAERVALPLDGTPVDLAEVARPDEDPVRIELTGTYSFLLDGSELDALARTTNREGVAWGDASGARLVVLPAGARVVGSDPITHRYTIEIPRASSMRVGLDVTPLAMRHLVTASEARASLQGAIHLEHLVPPPPPAPAMAVMVEEVSEVPAGAWIGASAGGAVLLALGVLGVRRRRDPMRALLRRAERASRTIASDCAALGPAFDPVAASSARLLEAATRTETHRRAVEGALSRTAWASAAKRERARLHERSEGARLRLAHIVARLEQTATMLAGRRADTASVAEVDSLLGELGDDLDAAVGAEDELARLTS